MEVKCGADAQERRGEGKERESSRRCRRNPKEKTVLFLAPSAPRDSLPAQVPRSPSAHLCPLRCVASVRGIVSARVSPSRLAAPAISVAAVALEKELE